MCYDRLGAGHDPACAQACPTQSIQFGDLDELRERAQARVDALHENGVPEARLYGENPDDGIGGAGSMFLLLDEPEVYGLPPDPVVTTHDLPAMWRAAGAAAARRWSAGVVAAFAGRRTMTMADAWPAARRRGRGRGGDGAPVVPDVEFTSYYGRPVVKPSPWEKDIAAYLFLGGLAGASSVLAAGADLTGRTRLRRTARLGAMTGISLSFVALVHDLGRPSRFVNMLRVAKPTSPMSVGTWILTLYGPAAGLAGAAEFADRLPLPPVAAAACVRSPGRPDSLRPRTHRPWPPTPRYCWPTPPPRAGTPPAGNCRSYSSARLRPLPVDSGCSPHRPRSTSSMQHQRPRYTSMTADPR